MNFNKPDKISGLQSLKVVRSISSYLLISAFILFSLTVYAYEDGDIIFQTSNSRQAALIEKVTLSHFSHMGMIFNVDGSVYVFEAAGTVRYTPFDQWVANGFKSEYTVMRLNTVLSAEDTAKLKTEAAKFLGKPYDALFLWSDDKMYCSELVWKVYKNALNIELSHPKKLSSFNIDFPGAVEEIRLRYGDFFPADEPAVSPQMIFDSRQLIEVE